MRSVDFILSRLNLYQKKYCFFVGAGISVCAGVPLSTKDLPGLPSIVSHIRRDFYLSLGNDEINENELLSWYMEEKLLQNSESLYSDALNLIGDTPRSRQHYLRPFFEGKKPGTCHVSIAKLIDYGHIDIVLTTNFDTLIEDAIRNNDHRTNPKVAAHSESAKDILITEEGPKVIKLHGDYLFSDIKNTSEETEILTKQMRDRLESVLKEKGLIVIGYSGNDNSIVSIFEQMAYNGGFFPYGFYWLHREGSPPRPRVEKIVGQVGGKVLSVKGAESFLDELKNRLGDSS